MARVNLIGHGAVTARLCDVERAWCCGNDCGALAAELQKCWRDAKLCQIYEGTNQLNRLEVYGGLVAHEPLGGGGRSSRNDTGIGVAV